ncbi:hypothetical protein [Bacteroides ovatus]|jgi:hypothetical protein|uniref:hypothetical protein n=1 Tax=Bacteroides ovatus TaxID=28116 RepID=UPI001F3B4C3D|nr:hypothetical protein [Bacteroides ovatus]MCE8873712.1 hypothetical protein [Bacteroides ovatus]
MEESKEDKKRKYIKEKKRRKQRKFSFFPVLFLYFFLARFLFIPENEDGIA